MSLQSREEIRQAVSEAVQNQPITDVHTHLYSANFGDLLLWDIDELLTYHYLVAEVMRWSDIAPEDFWKLTKQEQAEHIWQHLFLDRTPVSEAGRGVLNALKELGFDPGTKDLKSYREELAKRSTSEQIKDVLERANISNVVMTNDPFDEKERAVWESGKKAEAPFHAVLRLDPLLNDYGNTKLKLREWGYDLSDEWNDQSIKETQRFLEDWIGKMNPLYMAVSLPPTFAFPEDSDRGRIIRDCILPLGRKHNIAFAMMIGVKKQVNPALGDAGDFVGKADISAVQNLLSEFPQNKFLVTMLSRENQHELAVLARKFRNLMVFGCWWFMNNPVITNEITRMRMEMLNTSFIPQHSDARVLEQVIYKWKHTRLMLTDVLTDKYADIAETGWKIEKEAIEKDVKDLLHQNFWRFIEKDFTKL
ncbi:glucuronate isomerase [Alteribacillus sp. HJP-4]|uniref:glucuronate isomerase n=1 Tax=Alteribacillus sp. HJP-4 TaxID=2775394 RepID=UPI0035CCED48